jgi:hypothetical protein
LHHEEVGYPNAPNQVVVDMEVEVSLVGDGNYSKVVLVNIPLKGKGGKRYMDLVLGLVRGVKEEEEEEEEEEERGNNLKRK